MSKKILDESMKVMSLEHQLLNIKRDRDSGELTVSFDNGPFNGSVKIPAEGLAAVGLTANVRIAKHQSDDGEAIDDAWLNKIATVPEGSVALWVIGDIEVLRHGFRDGYYVTRQEPLARISGVTTRGQLRKLIEVLKPEQEA